MQFIKVLKLTILKNLKFIYSFGLNGASISMPYKESIVNQLDHLDKISKN